MEVPATQPGGVSGAYDINDVRLHASRSAYQYWIRDNAWHEYFWTDNEWKHETFPRGPQDGSAVNACHYHYHSMDLFKRILELSLTSHYLQTNQDFIDGYHGLLYGRDRTTGDANVGCSIRSAENIRGVPLAELFLSSMTPNMTFQLNAASGLPPSNDPDDYQKCWIAAVPFLDGGADTRVFFDEKYAGCSFAE